MMQTGASGCVLGLSFPFAYYSKDEECSSGCASSTSFTTFSVEPEARLTYNLIPEFYTGASVGYSLLLSGTVSSTNQQNGRNLEASLDLDSFSFLGVGLIAGYLITPRFLVETQFGYLPTGSVTIKIDGLGDPEPPDFTGFSVSLGLHYRIIADEVAVSPEEKSNNTKKKGGYKRRSIRKKR